MSYLNSLPNRLRKVAREVCPLDPYRAVSLTNMNKYTRMYWHRIVQRAENHPFNFIVTDLQLARLFHLPVSKFLQWFHHDVKLPKVFRRVRWFLREMIRLNILEDRGQLDESAVSVTLFDRPDRRTMAEFRRRAEIIRVEYQNRGPRIEKQADAVEVIGWIQSAYSSASSVEDDDDVFGEDPVEDDDDVLGEDPEEEREVREDTPESTDARALNGLPAILTDEQLSDQLKNVRLSDDDHVFLPVVDDVSD